MVLLSGFQLIRKFEEGGALSEIALTVAPSHAVAI
jgi:hypothetical protein